MCMLCFVLISSILLNLLCGSILYFVCVKTMAWIPMVERFNGHAAVNAHMGNTNTLKS